MISAILSYPAGFMCKSSSQNWFLSSFFKEYRGNFVAKSQRIVNSLVLA